MLSDPNKLERNKQKLISLPEVLSDPGVLWIQEVLGDPSRLRDPGFLLSQVRHRCPE